MTTARLEARHTVGAGDPGAIGDLLVRLTGLSRTAVKDALAKGAGWRARRGRPAERVRTAKATIAPGDRVELYYDLRVLAAVAEPPAIVEERRTYGVWWKPAGMLTQGTKWGDHAALLRHVARLRGAEPHLVHRLDREVAGLVVLAYDRKAAAALAAQFRERRVLKRYHAEVRGDLRAAHGERGTIDLPIDGDAAKTSWELLRYDPARDASVVAITLHTGRKHQIRRHLDALGHPVLGDPRYGAGNKNLEGLRLVGVELAFRCPERGVDVRFVAPDGAAPF